MSEKTLEVQGQVLDLQVETIVPNPYQPREHFDEAALNDLAASIKAQGLQQPVIVRVHPQEADKYQLVMGERRLRAHKLLGLATIHGIVRAYTDEQMQELALIENLQRDDLKLMEEARSLHKLQERLGSVQSVADKIGKSLSYVTRRLMLLGLPGEVQTMIDEEKILAAHADVIIDVEGVENQIEAAKLAAKLNLPANQLRGRMLKHIKPKGGNGGSNGVVKFGLLSSTVVRLYDAVDGFDFGMLRDENKRDTLRKQIKLLQASLEKALENLDLPVEEDGGSED